LIQLEGDRIPVEETWVRGTTNASMVDETSPKKAPRVGTEKAKKLPASATPEAPAKAKEAEAAPAKDAKATPAKEDEAAPTKEAAIQIMDNIAGFDNIANGTPE
jgi:hypothetical protein